MIDIQALIEQQLVIGKLKKLAKIFKKNNSTFTLMQCQDIIAQQHGYLHWHELHTLLKKKLSLLNSDNVFSFEKNNNLFLGKDTVLDKDIYIYKHFRKVHIQKNTYSDKFTFNLFEKIIQQQSKFIYCYKENNLDLKNKIIQSAQNKNIPVYTLSFNEKNNNLSINFNHIGSGAITEIFVKLILEHEDHDADMWAGRAISMGSSLFMALAYLRDSGEIQLTPKLMKEYFMYDSFISLYKREDLPKHIHAALKAYLFSLPGFELNKKPTDTTLELHGYLQMQYSKVLGLMVDSYPFVFNNDKNSVLDILQKQEKFILLVELTDYQYTNDELFNIFFCMFIQSFAYHFDEKELRNYHYYFLLDDIQANINLPSKLAAAYVSFLVMNNIVDRDLTITPTELGVHI